MCIFPQIARIPKRLISRNLLIKNSVSCLFPDINVYIGKEKDCRAVLLLTGCRMTQVARTYPEGPRQHTEKGKQLTEEYLDWLRFNFFITNVSCEIWQAEVVGTVSRLGLAASN